MPQCPECNSVKMFCDPTEGDGNCSSCHGTGFAEFCDAIALELLNVEQPLCEACNGSGRCQTCGGMGVIEETQLIAAYLQKPADHCIEKRAAPEVR